MGENQSLEHVFAALKAFGGYFVLQDEDGTEYSIQRKKPSESDVRSTGQPQDVQLTFTTLTSESDEPESDSFEEDVAAINRTLAALNLDPEDTREEAAVPPPRRVRFEPLRGDLPPELQE